MEFKFKFVLGLAGFSEAEIAEFEKALPIAERLLDIAKALGPEVEKALPDILAVIPAAKIILTKLKGS